MNYDLTNWKSDGKGTVTKIADSEFEVTVETPFTLWSPDEIKSDVKFSFDCNVTAPNSAMLFIAQAKTWNDSAPANKAELAGAYDDYNSGDYEMYTVGFNRTGHVTTDIQPNASTSNIRRIGGQDFKRFSSDKMKMGTDNADMVLWNEWDLTSLMGSACEFASGTNNYFHYDFIFTKPKISVHLEGTELFTLIDHRPNPLQGGCWAIRNMTPGGSYLIKGITAEEI
ncbi:MAG: DUF1961 family protein [Planctomycetota bacterium]|jgi:hypothetical protein